MKSHIQQYIKECDTCQRSKNQALSPAGLLQPLPVPGNTWTDVAMDFIGGLPKAMDMDTVMVVVNRMTKYAQFCPLAHPYMAEQVAAVFVKEIVRLNGFPCNIVSDRDRVFMSTFWTEMFRMASTKLCYSSAYHPQNDGQSEAVNKCLETYLRCFIGSKPKQWPKWLTWAEYWNNTNYHRAIRMTPLKALYGREPPVLIRGGRESTNDEVQGLMEERN